MNNYLNNKLLKYIADKKQQDEKRNKKSDVLIVEFENEEKGYYRYSFLLTKKIDSSDKISKIYDAILKIINNE